MRATNQTGGMTRSPTVRSCGFSNGRVDFRGRRERDVPTRVVGAAPSNSHIENEQDRLASMTESENVTESTRRSSAPSRIIYLASPMIGG